MSRSITVYTSNTLIGFEYITDCRTPETARTGGTAVGLARTAGIAVVTMQVVTTLIRNFDDQIVESSKVNCASIFDNLDL
jgi:hypothetical protein